MNRIFITATAALLISTTVAAQSIAPDAPHAIRSERITTADGTAVTYEYDANKNIKRIVSPKSVATFEYGANAEQTSVTVQVDKLSLTVTGSKSGALAAPGMAAVADFQHFKGGREIAVLSEHGETIADYFFRDNGQLASVKTSAVTLNISEPKGYNVTESLVGTDGKEIAATTASGFLGGRTRAFSVGLDAVASYLGLPNDWQNNVRIDNDPGGNLTTISDTSGKKLLYIVGGQFPGSVGFTTSGQPLFYDIPVDLSGFRISEGGKEEAYVNTGAVGPDHVIFTKSGDVGFYVSHASENSFQSVWVKNGNSKKPSVSYRTFQLTNENAKSHIGVSATRSKQSTSLRRTIQTDVYMQYLDTICTSYSGGRFCVAEYVLIDDSDSGGCTSGGGGGGGHVQRTSGN